MSMAVVLVILSLGVMSSVVFPVQYEEEGFRDDLWT